MLELRRGPGEWGFECFFTLAAACGHDYYYELCASGRENPSGYYHNADLIVNVGSLQETVGRMHSER